MGLAMLSVGCSQANVGIGNDRDEINPLRIAIAGLHKRVVLLRLALGLVLFGWCTVAVGASADVAVWVQRVESQDQAKRYQGDLYLTLYNSGRLPTRVVDVGFGAVTLQEILHRHGVWVGDTTIIIDALLCDLNPELCDRPHVPVDAKVMSDVKTHLGGYAIDQRPAWKNIEGAKLRLPAIFILQTYAPEPAGAEYLSQPATVPHVVSKPCAAPCLADYEAPSMGQVSTGTLRPILVTTDGQASQLPWDLSGKPLSQTAYVPRLTSEVPLSLESLEVLSALPRAPGFDFEATGVDGLTVNLQNSLVFSAPINTENNAFENLTEEPNFDRQKALFDLFCNVVEHGSCPVLPDSSTFPIVVTVVDRPSDLTHCDLTGQTFVVIDPATPGTLEVVESTPVTSNVPDCDGAPVAALEENHGTHIVGLLAARKNQRGIVGLTALRENIHLIVVPYDEAASRTEPGYPVQLADALARASTEGTDVFNLSLTFPVLSTGDPIENLIGKNENFTLFVAAAGKQGLDANKGFCLAAPACLSAFHPNLISVVGVEWFAGLPRLLQDSQGVTGTNFGSTHFTILAPAKDIISTVDGDQYALMSGTSQATAIVTAAAALLMQNTNWQPDKIKDRLVFSSSLHLHLLTSAMGGVVDVQAALMTSVDRVRDDNDCVWFGEAIRIVSAATGEAANDIPILVEGNNTEQKFLPFPKVMRIHENGDETLTFFFYEPGGAGRLTRQVSEYAIRPTSRILVFDVATSPNCEVSDRRMEFNLADIADYLSDGLE